MSRRNRRREEQARPLSAGYASRRRGDFIVQSIPGSQASKQYICPGCNQRIAIGVPHVGWPQHRGVDERRHWHNPCWARSGHSM